MGDGWTADFNQRSARAHGEGMQQAHANLLSSATLALDEDGNIGLRDPLQLISDGLHRGGLAENDVQRRQVKRGGGFGVVNQCHFFLSALGRPAKFAIRFTPAR